METLGRYVSFEYSREGGEGGSPGRPGYWCTVRKKTERRVDSRVRIRIRLGPV